jgi:hypothetical protein
MEVIAEEALPSFLVRQRWNPATDAGTPAVALTAVLPLQMPGLAAAVATWLVTPPCQTPLHLFVPLALVPTALVDEHQVIARPEGQADCLVEAFSADAFVRAWIELLLRHGGETSGTWRLRTGQTAQLARAELKPGITG